MAEPILKIEQLTVGYGDLIAVASASLEIRKGEVAALIGSNGAGKSTLMNTIAGIHKAGSGRICFKDEEISKLTPDRILNLGLSLVPQGGRCFSRMSVEDNLLMGSYTPRARKKAKETLAFVYDLFPVLLQKKSRPAGTLSGGQRQMVAIGRALMSCPELILFDELSLGLAPIVIGELYECIKRINSEQGTSVLLVEQDTERVLRASNTCFVMLKGEIVLTGRSAGLDSETVKHAYFGI